MKLKLLAFLATLMMPAMVLQMLAPRTTRHRS